MIPAQVLQLDEEDHLAHKRAAFELPEGIIYLNGNSLGTLPVSLPARMQALIEQEWGTDLITSWNKHGWINLPEQTAAKLAPLLGAAAGQVICCDSVSINLFKLLGAVLQLRSERPVILSQADNFPTDLYVAQGLESLLGAERVQLKAVPASEVRSALNEQVAVLYLTQVNFRSGALHDIESLTAAAHDQGALVIWDLSHSAGVVPLALDAWNVDFAVGCGYKFLNGGPGAPSFIYVNERHHGQFQQPLQGWMGHESPFAFDPDYRAAKGIKQFLTGTPNILSLAALDAALDVFVDVATKDLYDKAQKLTGLFIELVSGESGLQELKLESPAESNKRGAQLAYSHEEAWGISRALHAEGVMVDYREPDLLRIGFSPLVVSFADVWHVVQKLRGIMETEAYKKKEFEEKPAVT